MSIDLTAIDWENDDGVSFPMINDFVRNSFYDRIFKNTVKDKVCLEIGFGTGLLSMLALKHGAKKIVAFESDQRRYGLGQEVVSRLDLADKIKLHYGRYHSNLLYNFSDVEVIFGETVNESIWGEGLHSNIPTDNKVLFVPGNYFFEIHAREISRSFAESLLITDVPNRFSPGIDIDINFQNVINEIISNRYKNTSNLTQKLPNGLVRFNQWNNRNYWQITIDTKTSQQTPLVRYEVDVNKREFIIEERDTKTVSELNNSKTNHMFLVNTSQWADKILLLIPRVGIKHENDMFYLDNANSWGPAGDPVLLVNHTNDVVIKHDFLNGQITIT